MAYRVHVRIPLSPNTGYGRDGLGLVRALANAGADITLDPTTVQTPIPADIAMLLTKNPEPPFDLWLDYREPETLGLTSLEKKSAYKHFAWSMWEFSHLGEGRTEDVARRLTGYDAVVAPDQQSVDVFSALTNSPVFWIPGGAEVDLWNPEGADRYRDWHYPTFRVLSAGMLTARKNVYTLAHIVSDLHKSGVNIELTLKARGTELLSYVDDLPGVTVLRRMLTTQEMKTMYLAHHAYVAPSWGEGKNLPAIEAGITGCALVLSDIPGHRSWAMDEFTEFIPLGKDERLIDSTGLTTRQADPEALEKILVSLAEDREKARQMGYNASQIIPRTVGWDNNAKRLLDIVATL